MTYYGAADLARSFRTVRENTIRIAEDVPEDRYSFVPAEGSKTIGQMLVHIAVSPRIQLMLHSGERRTSFEGIDFMPLMEEMAREEATIRTKAEVIRLLQAEGKRWAGFIEGLSEEVLAERFTMPAGAMPASKSRFEMCLSVKEHEMHHRAQLMLAQRLLGIVPHLTRARQAQAEQQAAAAGGSTTFR